MGIPRSAAVYAEENRWDSACNVDNNTDLWTLRELAPARSEIVADLEVVALLPPVSRHRAQVFLCDWIEHSCSPGRQPGRCLSAARAPGPGTELRVTSGG